MVLDDVAGEHHLLVGYPDDGVAGGMGAAELHDVDAALAEIDGHLVGECGGRAGEGRGISSWPWNSRGKRPNSLSPVLLAAFLDHGGLPCPT